MHMQACQWALLQVQMADQRSADQDQDLIVHYLTIAVNGLHVRSCWSRYESPGAMAGARGYYLMRWPGLAPLSGLSR